MRIYAVADIHGKADRIASIRKTLTALEPAALIIAGDIVNFSNSAAVIKEFNRMPVPVFAIRGNTDPPKVDRLLDHYPNTFCLHLKEYRLDEISLVGAGGTIPLPFSSRIGFREKRILRDLAPRINDKSVLVVHPPPRGTLDQVFGSLHAGCRRLLELIEQRRPRLVLCGHIHERPGVAAIGRTQIVNCCLTRTARGAVIEFNSKGSLDIRMLSDQLSGDR